MGDLRGKVKKARKWRDDRSSGTSDAVKRTVS